MPHQTETTSESAIHQPTIAAPKRYKCRHLFLDGHRCGSPSLRGEEFCYYHHTTHGAAADLRDRRNRRSDFELPLLEDRSSVLAAITEVLQRIASGSLHSKTAGLLLYGLQIASRNLPQSVDAEHNPPVEEIVLDPRLGHLAPIAEITEPAILPTLQATADPTALLPHPPRPHVTRSGLVQPQPHVTPHGLVQPQPHVTPHGLVQLEPHVTPTEDGAFAALQATADPHAAASAPTQNSRHLDRRRRICRRSGETPVFRLCCCLFSFKAAETPRPEGMPLP